MRVQSNLYFDMPKTPIRAIRKRKRAGRAKQRMSAASVPRMSKSSRCAMLVLGMHRSGTSAVTRFISMLGADLPKNLMRANAFNEKGYWESDEIVAINDNILKAAGSSWDDWKAIRPDWFESSECVFYKQQLLDILDNDFSNSSLFVVKDPRICRLVPLWLDVLKRFGAEPKS